MEAQKRRWVPVAVVTCSPPSRRMADMRKSEITENLTIKGRSLITSGSASDRSARMTVRQSRTKGD
jgi:hypothetical protein